MLVEELFATLGLKVDKESFEVGDKALESIHRLTEAFLGFEGVKKLGEMIEGVEEQAVGAERLAQKIGVTTDAVQQLGYAAKVTGVSNEELQVGFVHLARGVDEFTKKGSGDAAKAFARLGIEARELKKESLDQNLELIAEKFSKLPDGATKTAIAMDIFGRSGANLIPLLNKGQEGIVELRNEAQRLGVVIDQDSIKKFHELEETQNRLGAAWDGIKIQLAEGLLPTLADLGERLFKWVQANRDLIAQRLQDVVEALLFVARALGSAIAFVAEVMGFLNEHAALAKALIVGLAGAFLYLKTEAVEAGIATALAWAEATIEFLAIAAVIAAIALAAYEVGAHLGEIAEWFSHAWINAVDGLRDMFRGLWNWMVDGFEDIGRSISSVFWGAIDGIRDAFVSMINWIIDKLNWVLSKVPFVDATIGHIGAAAAPSAIAEAITPTGGFNPNSGAGGTVVAGGIGHQEIHTTIHIHASGADAAQVERIVREQTDAQIRSAAGTLGTGAR